ncbi:MAG: hypothetical protein AAGA15_00155 [Pseudomonadota bacterium]
MRRFLTCAVLGALILAGLYRLIPLALGMPALAERFLTEDGYLMLTVARNMGIGLGMSVSDGTIATNGVQPLIACLFAVPYWATGGDKVTSLYAVHGILAAAALGALFATRSFAARALAWREVSGVWPWAVAALWFAGPLLLYHSMNGLETGLATLCILLALLAFHRVLAAGEAAGSGLKLGLGALCGLAFLARNDAAFLAIGVFAVWWAVEISRAPRVLGDFLRRSLALVPPGLACLAVAAPWMINNQLRFGSIVPISGTAQSVAAETGQNLGLLPAKLFEHTYPMLPLPGGIETVLPVQILASLAVAAPLLWLLWRTFRQAPMPVRAMVAAYLIHLIALAAYYGINFGAPHFLSRYLAPAAPLLILGLVSALLDLGRVRVAAGVVAASLVLSLALLGRLLIPGVHAQGHEQVAAWTAENVPPETWVGAVQTGTLGYWHDRTFNLDGKVNPAALAARRTDGHVLDYVVESSIEYVIDWYGVGGWADRTDTAFPDTFERIVWDREENLAVMRRKGVAE